MADIEAGKGWSDRELLSSLLSIIERSKISLNYKDGIYPDGRNASGFSQKLNRLKGTLKPEWGAMSAGRPVPTTPTKEKATPKPRKRKTKNDGEENVNGENTGSPPKRSRGRPKKTPESVSGDKGEENTNGEMENGTKKGARGGAKKTSPTTVPKEEDAEDEIIKDEEEAINGEI